MYFSELYNLARKKRIPLSPPLIISFLWHPHPFHFAGIKTFLSPPLLLCMSNLHLYMKKLSCFYSSTVFSRVAILCSTGSIEAKTQDINQSLVN